MAGIRNLGSIRLERMTNLEHLLWFWFSVPPRGGQCGTHSHSQLYVHFLNVHVTRLHAHNLCIRAVTDTSRCRHGAQSCKHGAQRPAGSLCLRYLRYRRVKIGMKACINRSMRGYPDFRGTSELSAAAALRLRFNNLARYGASMRGSLQEAHGVCPFPTPDAG